MVKLFFAKEELLQTKLLTFLLEVSFLIACEVD